MRKAFTLIELLISIVILTILMLFLYKSYSGLNRLNALYSQEVEKISRIELMKKVIYLDFSLAIDENNASAVNIANQSKTEDVVFFQTTHSVHDRINPYVAYVAKEGKLYRLESLKKFREYPFGVDSEFIVDALGSVENFRVYKSTRVNEELYVVHLVMKENEEIILKIKVLNGN